jgi:hypothetical protein
MQNDLTYLTNETFNLNELYKHEEINCNNVRIEYNEWKRKPFDEMHREVQSLKNAIVLISNHNRLLTEKIAKQVKFKSSLG